MEYNNNTFGGRQLIRSQTFFDSFRPYLLFLRELPSLVILPTSTPRGEIDNLRRVTIKTYGEPRLLRTRGDSHSFPSPVCSNIDGTAIDKCQNRSCIYTLYYTHMYTRTEITESSLRLPPTIWVRNSGVC